ncbi:tetratricopeptide repeat protein, partial [Candidatus Neomarinimicrobiota bacterium]
MSLAIEKNSVREAPPILDPDGKNLQSPAVGAIPDRKKDLERHFANDFTTLSYCMLAEIYLEEDDLARATRVCEIGLTHHPGHAPGLHIMAMIAIREGRLADAEKLLENVLNQDSSHQSAAELNIAVKERLR